MVCTACRDEDCITLSLVHTPRLDVVLAVELGKQVLGEVVLLNVHGIEPRLLDVELLAQEPAQLGRVLGAKEIPHCSTEDTLLGRLGSVKHDVDGISYVHVQSCAAVTACRC